MLKLETAGGCAWRGLYLSTMNKGTRIPLARLVLDPTASTPNISGAIACGLRDCYLTRQGIDYPEEISFRFKLPTLRFKSGSGWIRMYAYSLIGRFYGSLDGRYGIGSEIWKQRRAAETWGKPGQRLAKILAEIKEFRGHYGRKNRLK